MVDRGPRPVNTLSKLSLWLIPREEKETGVLLRATMSPRNQREEHRPRYKMVKHSVMCLPGWTTQTGNELPCRTHQEVGVAGVPQCSGGGRFMNGLRARRGRILTTCSGRNEATIWKMSRNVDQPRQSPPLGNVWAFFRRPLPSAATREHGAGFWPARPLAKRLFRC